MKIRLIKERCRALFSTLPCSLCKQLLIALVKFVISRINMLPVLGSRATAHAWNRPSPRELLTGIKTSFTRDLRIGFLDYAQLTEPVNETTYNSPMARTRGGVALYSLGNTKGTVIFMTLDTGIEVVREKFHLPLMPDVVISHLNALAAKDKKTISADPVFLYRGLIIPDDTPSHDADDIHFSPLSTCYILRSYLHRFTCITRTTLSHIDTQHCSRFRSYRSHVSHSIRNMLFLLDLCHHISLGYNLFTSSSFDLAFASSLSRSTIDYKRCLLFLTTLSGMTRQGN